MATLPGGVTVSTQGITQQDMQQLTSALSNVGGTITKETQTLTSSSITTNTLAAPITLGNTTVSSVGTVAVNGSGSGTGNTLVAVDLSATPAGTSTGGGTVVTNVVADSSLTSIVLTGTSSGNTTALFLDASSGGKVIAGDSGNNFLVLSGSGTVGTGTNTVIAGIGNDSVIGSNTSDVISSSGGNDIINGGSGNDTITAGTGDATLGGGGGNDSLVAGSGNSIMIGESGNDTLVAGAGKDVMIFSPGSGNDTIVGFDPTKDTIAFAGTNYSGGTLDLASVIQNAVVAGGNTTLNLPDGTTITVQGVTGININWFTAK
jgi:Ca2+-binding RTX toxin-like protein